MTVCKRNAVEAIPNATVTGFCSSSVHIASILDLDSICLPVSTERPRFKRNIAFASYNMVMVEKTQIAERIRLICPSNPPAFRTDTSSASDRFWTHAESVKLYAYFECALSLMKLSPLGYLGGAVAQKFYSELPGFIPSQMTLLPS
jgi:hypothetical protein